MPETLTKTLVIPSTLKDAHNAQEAIMQAVRGSGVLAEAAFGIRLALDEALSNAVRHGNGADPCKKVTIAYIVSDDTVEISISDQGEGFKPGDVPDPTLAENLERPHGRGIMLMKAYMSAVRFNGEGNRVTLVKIRDGDD